jgi:hypothetical protein
MGDLLNTQTDFSEVYRDRVTAKIHEKTLDAKTKTIPYPPEKKNYCLYAVQILTEIRPPQRAILAFFL